VPSILWLEDAHLIAYAMVYDIAVFVYKGDENTMKLRAGDTLICISLALTLM